MYFSLFLLVWLTLPILGFWPIVKKTDEGWYNNSMIISIKDPNTVSKETHLHAYCEELAEWYFKSFVFGILVLPYAIFVAGTDPLLNFSAFMLMQFLSLFLVFPVVYRIVEYVGKSANIAIMPRDNTGAATRLLKFYPAFKGMELEAIKQGIDNAKPIGTFLIWLLKRNITKHTT